MIPDETLGALRQIDTPTLCNAIEEFKIRDRTEGFMGFDIKCLFPALGTMLGYAVTCTGRSTVPGPPGNHAGAVRLWEAIEESPKPCVVVIKDVGPDRHRSCHYGDMMATLSKRLGAIGLVTDGGVRDVRTVEEMGFHYFAAGVTPAHGNNEIVEVGPRSDRQRSRSKHRRHDPCRRKRRRGLPYQPRPRSTRSRGPRSTSRRRAYEPIHGRRLHSG